MSASSGGGMLNREEENDVEVRREDQENINKFGRLNARLYEAREESTDIKVGGTIHIVGIGYRIVYRVS